MVDHFKIYGIRIVIASRIASRNKLKHAETHNLKTYDKDLIKCDLQDIIWEKIFGPFVDKPCKIA